MMPSNVANGVFMVFASFRLVSGSPLFGVEENNVGRDVDYKSVINLEYLGKAIFGNPNEKTGDLVAQWNSSSKQNPEELGEYAEGDILVPQSVGRNGLRGEYGRWPEAVIPYVIEGYYNNKEMDNINNAIADYHRLTCIRFVRRTGERDYITINSRRSGCWSSVGKIGGRQDVNLQAPGCVSYKGTVQHELMHAIGFMHEQSRPERDNFVYINKDNIRYGTENNFNKADANDVEDFNITYDYNSVMHYSEYAFSRNGERTVVPKVNGVKVGQREGLSRGDIKKINAMYKCQKEEPSSGWISGIWSGITGH